MPTQRRHGPDVPLKPTLCMLPRAVALAVGLLLGLAAAPAWAEDAPREVDTKAQAAALIEGFKSKSPEIRVKAATQAKDVQHDSLTSPLVKLLSDKEWGVREAVIAALATRQSKAARKKASSSLVARLPRLTKDTVDEEELLLAIEALGALEQPAAVKPLLGGINLETDIRIVRARMNAVANIPDKKAIEGLIDFLARGRRGGAGAQRDAARKALQYATGADARARDHKSSGRDADRWRAWWRENEKHFDFEAVKAARAQAAADAAEEAAKAEAKKEARAKRKRDKAKQGKKQGKKPNKPAGEPKPAAPAIPD
ncbi:MAG: HEAT repeat domain-containing protein [Planctomycetota bacterium]|nr:HEAT repeat domain-containing protein [Planctomycetota bacterium]